MTALDVFLIIFLVILILMGVNNAGRLKEKISGGDRSNIKKLEKITNKKDAKTILDTLEDKFGDTGLLLDTKVDKIVNKFQNKTSYVSYSDILQSVNIHKNIIEDLNLPKEDESPFCDLYACPRCNSKKSTCKEVMKRATDEPTNIICNCLVCGFKFDLG